MSLWVDLPNSETLSNTWIDLPLSGSGSGSGVTSLNGETGAITLVAGTGISITESGQDITITNTGSGSGNVTGIAPTTVTAIAIWANTTATEIENSLALVQAGGAVQAQAFVADRQILNNVTVPDHYTMIQTEVFLISGDIILDGDAQLLLL
jgi:hypothetical protein